MSTFSHYTYTPPSLLLRLRRWCRENVTMRSVGYALGTVAYVGTVFLVFVLPFMESRL